MRRWSGQGPLLCIGGFVGKCSRRVCGTSGIVTFVHVVSIALGGVGLIVITVVDLLVIRNLPRSRQAPEWFFFYFLFTSMLAGVAVAFLTRNR